MTHLEGTISSTKRQQQSSEDLLPRLATRMSTTASSTLAFTESVPFDGLSERYYADQFATGAQAYLRVNNHGTTESPLF